MQINPGMLSWAREKAGLTLGEAAEKLALKNSARTTGAEKLHAMERGENFPTEAQLRRMAAVYRRPLITFYMAEPPRKVDRGQDFRAMSGSRSVREESLLDALTRDVVARQQILREVLEEAEEDRPLDFIGSASINQGASAVAAAIRKVLNFTEQEQLSTRDPAGLFARLRRAVEAVGVYVLLLGDVGSHHTDISEETFRGFALADKVAPFIVINDNDALTARSFTLMHELAHLWIGESGVSGPVRSVSENAVERFCNEVAGLFLLPPSAIGDIPQFAPSDTNGALLATKFVAEKWRVSQGVVAYRFLTEGRINDAAATELFAVFADRWRAEKQRRSAESESGPTYYFLRRHRLGTALLDVTRRALQDRILTHTRAAKLLGVNPSSVGTLLSQRVRTA